MIRPLIITGLLAFATVEALPPDFELTEFIGGLRDPATMAFAPDGRLFVGERIEGKLRVVTGSGQLLAAPFLTLDVPPVRHRSGGLRGFAFDPAFPAEPWVYVFYTRQFPGGVRHNRVSRFQVSASDPNLADAGSEEVLLELPFNAHPLGSSGSHNGGALAFGGDGMLYITTGDGWNASNGYGAGDNVQSLSTLTGKVLRIAPDGSIPPDNPFVSQTTGDHRAIYALGLRNPYAATVHPVSGELFVFDVGTAHGGNKDYVFRVGAGDNFGHDGASGIGTPASPWAFAGKQIVSGGVWYFADQFPASFRERLFVTSWKQGLRTVRSLGDNTVEEFGSADVPNQGPLYPAIGPDGSLFFLDSTYETSGGRVMKLSYTAVNRAAPPAISPNGGSFVDEVLVTLSSTTPGAEIRYTLDGSAPDVGASLYEGAISLNSSATLRTRTFAGGFDPSLEVSAVFDIDVSEAPAFTNGLPATTPLGAPLHLPLTASGNPAPTYSVVSGPPGLDVHPETGELLWVPQVAGSIPLTIRASNGVAPDALLSMTVEVPNMRSADSPDLGSLTGGGLRYSYFEDGPEAVATGVVPVPGSGPALRDTQFRFRFEGFLEVGETGLHEFSFATPGEAALFIGGVPVSGPIGLEAGLHEVVIDYAETTGPASLVLSWSGPSFATTPVPATAFQYVTEAFGLHHRAPLLGYLGVFPTMLEGGVPLLLSQTKAFANLSTLAPAPGVVPYEPNAKLWSDGADKLRWIAVPHGQTVGFAESGSWVFPPGTVLIKHFEIGANRLRIETRFEVIRPDGKPYLVTYRWREDQTEADLVPPEGASGLLSVDGVEQSWAFPSHVDCAACHNASVGHVLGLSTRQLNGSLRYASGVEDNQLRTWSHLALFDTPPVEASLSSLDSLCEIDDPVASLEQRVRSYLDANCAYCHNSTAAPEGTAFVLEYETPLAESGMVGGLAADSLGLGPHARVIAARDPARSVLYHRLAGNDPATRMPPVGRDIVHAEAREALVRWILSLPPSNTVTDVPGYSRRWTFDGQIDSGTWRDGTAGPVFAAGQVGQALEFDGVDDAVDLGPLDVSGDTGLTIAFWFKADDFGTSDARFISKADGQFDADHYWMVSTLNGTKLRFRLRAGGSTSNLVSEANAITAGTWTHVATVYDGATMKIYKDGVEIASQAKTGVLDSSGTVDAAIGNQPTTASGGARPFDGLIDDMRLYPRALDPGEIALVRDGGGVPNAAPTIALPLPAGAVGEQGFITRRDVANTTATASDSEDGPLAVSWLSTTSGSVDPATLPDGHHTLIATARDSNGSADSALLELHVVPGFEGWTADRGWPAVAGQLEAGVPLLIRYLLGLEPGEPFPDPQLLAGPSLRYEFAINPRAIDATLHLETGADLGNLVPAATWAPLGDTPINGIYQTAPAPVGFGRLRGEWTN